MKHRKKKKRKIEKESGEACSLWNEKNCFVER